jgi:hypothetical protein
MEIIAKKQLKAENNNTTSTKNIALYVMNFSMLTMWGASYGVCLAEGWYQPQSLFLTDAVMFFMAMFDIFFLTSPESAKDDMNLVKYFTTAYAAFNMINMIIWQTLYAEMLQPDSYKGDEYWMRSSLLFGSTWVYWANFLLASAMSADLWFRDYPTS